MNVDKFLCSIFWVLSLLSSTWSEFGSYFVCLVWGVGGGRFSRTNIYSGSQKIGESVISGDMLCLWPPLDACRRLFLFTHNLSNTLPIHTETRAYKIKRID